MRCFIAVDVAGDAERALGQVIANAKAMDLDAAFANERQLHCTLAFLGEKNEAEVKKIVESLQKVRQDKFVAAAAGLGFFPNEKFARVFWAGLQSSGLVELQKKVVDGLGLVNEKPFKPHVTLARIKSKRNLRQLREYVEANENNFFGEFPVNSFVLKKSVLSPQGAVYEGVAEFALV